jgi:hypothetical protein
MVERLALQIAAELSSEPFRLAFRREPHLMWQQRFWRFGNVSMLPDALEHVHFGRFPRAPVHQRQLRTSATLTVLPLQRPSRD